MSEHGDDNQIAAAVKLYAAAIDAFRAGLSIQSIRWICQGGAAFAECERQVNEDN